MTRVTASDPIGMDELRAMARERFGDLVKGVVDLRRGVDSMVNLRRRSRRRPSTARSS